METAIDVSAYPGDWNAAGGVIPRMRSRSIPPPTAVVMPRIATPKMSIFFDMATTAPETAKAIVPRISKATKGSCSPAS